MPGLTERCSQLRAEVARLDVTATSGEDCRVLAEELARCEKTFAAARARAAARAAACGAHRRAGFGDPAEWLARSTGSSLGTARAELKTAEILSRCPRTDEALREGRVSLAQAGEITRAEADCPGSEAELVAVAGASGLAALRDEARKRRLHAVDPDTLAARQRSARTFRHWRDDLGMVRFTGALEPRFGVGLMNRLEAEAERIRRRARREGAVEPFEAYAADALVALASAEGETPSRGRPEVVFVCDLRAYRRGHPHAGEPCHVRGGGPVPVSVVEDALHDAFVKAVTSDGVRIHSVVHWGRSIPAHLRTALELGRPPEFEGAVCAEDGCSRRWGLEWDHVNPVANGGPTSYENLQPRCWPCHGEKTQRDRAAGLLGSSPVASAGRRGPDPP